MEDVTGYVAVAGGTSSSCLVICSKLACILCHISNKPKMASHSYPLHEPKQHICGTLCQKKHKIEGVQKWVTCQ